MSQFLRSINICYDAESPQRIEHFHPTSKSIPLIESLWGNGDDRCFLIIAPYGSGKSLTASFLLHAIENSEKASKMLAAVGERLTAVSPDLGKFLAKRNANKEQHGLVVALHGYVENLPAALKQGLCDAMSRTGLGRQKRGLSNLECNSAADLPKLFSLAKQKMSDHGFDRISIVWDEFGRHLESLVESGHSAELLDVQALAEYTSRSNDIPMTLGMFLHQGLLQYSGNLPQSARAEWKKIEGRFKSIEFIDDSKEVLRLIGQIVQADSEEFNVDIESIRRLALNDVYIDLFSEFEEVDLGDLFSSTIPLEPFALYLLPKISARIAQNERTIFDFVHHVNKNQVINLEVLYDYFSTAMRVDTSVGGTHKHWVETESALSKVKDNPHAISVIKSTSLLSLGLSGHRQRASREWLEAALIGYESNVDWPAEIDKLISANLLLYRKHSEEVAVWHGTDSDLRAKLDNATQREQPTFELIEFLEQEFPAPVWKPVQYNDRYKIRRYFSGQYETLEGLKRRLESELHLSGLNQTDERPSPDGEIYFLVTTKQEELDEAREFVTNSLSHSQVIVVLPERPLELVEAALECHCLNKMQQDRDLIGSDPLVAVEIQHLADDAFAYLSSLLQRFLNPQGGNSNWHYDGSMLNSSTPKSVRLELSRIMESVFYETPVLNNEMINRTKPSAVVVNARKKMMLAVLERYGQENLGIEGNFPDMSIFRTLLLQTGLYFKDEYDNWGFRTPNALADVNLANLWETLRGFFTEPKQNKQLEPLFERLLAPPIGLRKGLIPIFLTCAYKAFGQSVSLTRKGEYIDDVLPSVIEEACKEPHLYRLSVLSFDENQVDYLRSFYERFTAVDNKHVSDNDLIRLCYDAIANWKFHLGALALNTARISEHAKAFRRAIESETDPVHLLLNRIPKALEKSIQQPELLIESVEAVKTELESAVQIFAADVKSIIAQVLQIDLSAEFSDIQSPCEQWARSFSEEFSQRLTDRRAKGLIVRSQMGYKTELHFLNSIAELFTGRGIPRWEDKTLSEFEAAIRSAVNSIESSILSSNSSEIDDGTRLGMASIIEMRVQSLYGQLRELLGDEEATKRLQVSIERAVKEN